MKNRIFFSLLVQVFSLNMWSSFARSELIEDFPGGCAFATLNQPLPYHILGYGRIRWMGGSWTFQYIDQSLPGPFAIAAIADNVGIMGQNPEQNISPNLMVLTPRDRYVVAQILDRSEMGLGPIVTCISPLFIGAVYANHPVVFGQDYWTEYRRFRDFKWDDRWRRRWDRWKHDWNHRVFGWKKHWQEKRKNKNRYQNRPKPPVSRKGDLKPKPGIVKPALLDRTTNRNQDRLIERERFRGKPNRTNIQRPGDDSRSRQRPSIQVPEEEQQERRKPVRRQR